MLVYIILYAHLHNANVIRNLIQVSSPHKQNYGSVASTAPGTISTNGEVTNVELSIHRNQKCVDL